MLGISKVKLGEWLLRKLIKWFKIEPHNFYTTFSNEINAKIKTIRDIEEQEAKDNFRRFWKAWKPMYGKINDDIAYIDKHTLLTKKCTEVPEWNKNHYETVPSSYESY